MSRDICREIVKNISGKEFSDAELDRLTGIVERQSKRILRANRTLSPNEAIQQAGEAAVEALRVRVLEKQRVALLNEGKRQAAIGSILSNWGDQPGLGLRSLVTGTQRNVQGARLSAAGQQDAIRSELVGGFHAALSKLGRDDLRLFTADVVEDDIARALWELSHDTPNELALAKLNPAARRIAKVIADSQDLARGLANKEGASIGRYRGYVAQATHDSLRISRSESEWRKVANDTFDLGRMMTEMNYSSIDSMLDSLYLTFSTGLHLKTGDAPRLDPQATVNLANRLSQSKVVHFKSAQGWTAYNRQFGYGNLRETVLHGLEHSARATGLMQVMGTNPGAFLESMEQQLAKELRKTGADATRFRKDVQAAKNRLAEVDGSLDVPGNSTLATYSQGIRSLQTMASLGGSLISSFADIGLFVVSARHNGINAFQAASAAAGGLFRGRTRSEQVEMASALGVVFESMAGKMASRFSVDDGGRGAIARGQQLFFQLNLQNWWTDSLRFAAAEMLSHNLASHAGASFDALPATLAKTLGLYGLDARGWDTARKAVQAAEDGKVMLSPTDVPDEGVRRALRAYFTDQNGYVMLSPDAETRYLSKIGTQRGTVAGEALRFAMQFKSYSIAFSQKMIGRELIGHIDPDVRGAGVFGKAMANGSAVLGISQLVVMTTLLGYLSMSMKDLLKGREPRDPSDPRTALAAMQQGGGLGIMGDFLLGRENRAGGGFIGTVAGPTAGDIESLANLYFTSREAALDPEKENKVGDDLLRLTYSNAPGNNLFYVKPVMDYLVMWNLNETLNPGAMARMERNAARQGQEFFISPSARVAEQQR